MPTNEAKKSDYAAPEMGNGTQTKQLSLARELLLKALQSRVEDNKVTGDGCIRFCHSEIRLGRMRNPY